MSFPFSFFSQRRSAAPPVEPAVPPAPGEAVKEENNPWSSQLSDLPEGTPVTGGLAAMAVQQSNSGPLGPPSRRPNLAPAPAMAAAGLALAAQAPLPNHPFPDSPLPSAPSHHHFNSPQSQQNREIAQLRSEMEQMRQDLFGAAMGVSALKDRLDNLETAVEKKQVPSPAVTLSVEETRELAHAWLDEHIPAQMEQAMQRTLDQALQQAVASLTSSEFFRMPVHMPGLLPALLLSQAPQILSISPT